MQRTAARAAAPLAPRLSRRLLHSGGARDNSSFSVPLPLPRAAGLPSMDMSRAPGYAVAAEAPAPARGRARLQEFAARHGRLAPEHAARAAGFLWAGPVLYSAGGGPAAAAPLFTVSWEGDADASSCIIAPAGGSSSTVADEGDDLDLDGTDHPLTGEAAARAHLRRMYHAKRRYSGGQARRIRQQRQESILRRARKRAPTKPKRQPKNDIPRDEETT